MTSVLQPWVETMPIRMQSTLLLGLRGPDGHSTTYIKQWTRWLRGLVFRPGNPENVGQFMNLNDPPLLEDKGPLAQELYVMPQHYYSHLMHAVEVVAYRHPGTRTSNIAMEMYIRMADVMHLHTESPIEFEDRLCTIAFPFNKQPNTAEEAVELLQRALELGDDEP